MSLALVSTEVADDRPTVIITKGDMLGAVEAVEDAFAKWPERFRIFQRDGTVVRVARVDHCAPRSGVSVAQGTMSMLQVTETRMALDIQRAVELKKRDGRAGGKLKVCDPPPELCRALLHRAGDSRLKTLVGTTENPTLRADGSLLDVPGYDARSGLYFDPGTVVFPAIPSEPTKADAHGALETLGEIVSEFPFASPEHRAVALSAILTVVVRSSLKTAPAFAVSAPVMGSGKTLFATALGYLANGRASATMTVPKDDDELRKRALAIFMLGAAVVNIDNVAATFRSDVLCTILTSDTFSDRVLGSTRILTVPTAATFVLTGNNISFAGDITTRVLPIMLDPGVEHPEERSFRRDLHTFVPRERPRLVVAALTVLRAYVVAGRPRDPSLRPFGRFEAWDQLIRGALVWLGEPDPVLVRDELEDADPVRGRLRTVLQAWHEQIDEEPVSVTELLAMADARDGLKAALLSVAEDSRVAPNAISKKLLGYFLRSHARRVELGLRLTSVGKGRDGQRWAVQKVAA